MTKTKTKTVGTENGTDSKYQLWIANIQYGYGIPEKSVYQLDCMLEALKPRKVERVNYNTIINLSEV